MTPELNRHGISRKRENAEEKIFLATVLLHGEPDVSGVVM